MLFSTVCNLLLPGGRKHHQLFFVIRITAIFLLSCFLHVSAIGFSQKVTISGKNISLKTLFSTIEKQTGYVFVYDDEILVDAKPISIHAESLTVEEILNECLKNQSLSYSIEDKTIFISKQNIHLQQSRKEVLDFQYDVSGHVKSETGGPLVGATVAIAALNKTSITDENGYFILRNVLKGNHTIEITFVGYELYRKAIVISDNSLKFDATLNQTINSLDETVVKGYYNTTNRLNTGNVTTVKGNDIANQPVSNPILALEGMVPGMDIKQQSGAPGKAVTVTIRGKSSLFNGTNPLYVVDGVPMFQFPNGSTTFDNPNLPNTVGAISSPLISINPSDIESISVLKDADATAIYGTRGANGVILITTKKGKSGGLKVDATFYEGWGKATKLIKFLDTKDYLEMRHEAFANDGATIPTYAYDVNGTWDTTRNTDWVKKIYGGTSHYSDAQASISGGNQNTLYRFSFGYHRESTIFPGDFSDQRVSFSLSMSNSSLNNKLKSNFSLAYSNDNNVLPLVNPTNIASLPPDAPPIYDSSGELNWQNSTFDNPFNYLYQSGKNVTAYLNGSYNLSYEISPTLFLRGNFGYSTNDVEQYQKTPIISFNPAQTYQQSSAATASNSTKAWIIEPQLNYKTKIGQGTLDALIGSTFQQQSQQSSAIQGTGFLDDALLGTIAAASTVTVLGTNNSEYKYNSAYIRVAYNYNDKYVINATGRRDGSSRFGPGRQFGNFGSLGAAWIFSNTKFAESALSFLSFGKLRASYGVTGNDQIVDYAYLNRYTPQNNVTYFGSSTLLALGLPNPSYGWEKTKKFEVGALLGFLQDKITMEMSYYVNNSSNVLTPYPLPSFTGATSITANSLAHLRNAGVELSIISKNITKRDLTWTTSFNLTVPMDDSKLINYPNLSTSSYANAYVLNKSINIVKTLTSTGVNPTTDLYTFVDVDQDNQITFPNDYTHIVYTGKQFYGGILNSLRVKNFEIDILFQFARQDYAGNMLNRFGIPGMNRNIPVYMNQNAWRKSGDNAILQKFTNSDFSTILPFFNYASSNAMYSSASYLRLRNLKVSYSLPINAQRHLWTNNVKLFIQGQNLFVITSYLGPDPEIQDPNGVPPLKIITGGIQIAL